MRVGVVAAVHLDANGSGLHSINKIASVYGKGGTQWMSGKLRHYNKQKASKWLRAVGLQLPEANTIKRLNPRVVTDNDLVKLSGNNDKLGPARRMPRNFFLSSFSTCETTPG